MSEPPRPVPDGGLVDAHQHFWELAAHDQPWLALPGNEPLLRDYTEDELRPQAEAAGVTATVVVQTVTEASETTELLALAAGSDLVAGVVGWADLQSPAVADEIAAAAAQPGGQFLRGIRHPVLIEEDPDWLRRPAVQRGLRAVGAAGLCYDLVVPAAVLPAAIDAVTACPGVLFVLDHLGIPPPGPRPDERWLRDIRELALLPNVVCKLSGVLGEPPPDGLDAAGADPVAHLVPYYETVLGAFGPGRLIFGSDWPVCTVDSSYAGVVAAALALTAGLGAAERGAVLGGTARRVYRLDP
jgi:L-fuconolactonase